jgi:hypothetical protein
MPRELRKFKASLGLIHPLRLALALATIGVIAWPQHQGAQPSEDEQRTFVDAARRTVLAGLKRLPDFLCTETVQRSDSIAERSAGNESFIVSGPVDTLTIEVGYVGGKESFRLTGLNARPATGAFDEIGGVISRGEFGDNLRTIFDPASQARFRFERWADVDGRPAVVYSFTVEKSKANYVMAARQGAKYISTPAGLQGEAVIDRETNALLRLSYRPDRIPSNFPISESTVTVDYEEAEIAGVHYLLPSKASMMLRQGSVTSRNEATFHDYRKFAADSVINFDIGGGGRQP